MKKVFALLMAVVMLLSLTACGGGDETPTTQPNTPTAPAQTKPQESTQAPTEALTGELVETAFWSLRYDPEVWTFEDEDALYESDYVASLSLIVPNPEDEYDPFIYFNVDAWETDHHNFRSNLRYYGFDQYEYATNDAYDTVNIGGLEFLVDDSDDDYNFYFMRVFSAGVDVEITVSGDVSNEAVAALLETLNFTVEEGDNVDAPWYWEGTPYTVVPGQETVGTFTLESVQIPFASCIVTYETFDHNIAAVNDQVYIVNDGAVQVYSYDGSELTFVMDMGLEDYSVADASGDDVWLSGFMENLYCFDGENYTAGFEGTDYVSMCPSAPWGISWFSDSTVMKLVFDGATATEATEYTLAEVDTISYLCIDANGNVFVCGSSVSDGSHRVFVYNADMELQATLDSEDKSGLGCAVFATETENGFLVLDGNMREVVLYEADGTYIGCCDFDDLFGTDYPWPCDACIAADGSILVIMTDERPDESADELIAFKLTGF